MASLEEEYTELANKYYELSEKYLVAATMYKKEVSRICSNCEWGLEVDDKNVLLCGNAVCLGLDEYGQYVVTKDFGCNKFESRQEKLQARDKKNSLRI